MGKITVWNCPEHGEFEVVGDVNIAYCPRCGKSMTRIGEYEE